MGRKRRNNGREGGARVREGVGMQGCGQGEKEGENKEGRKGKSKGQREKGMKE